MVDPNNIADDGDDGLEYGRRGARTSMLSLGSSRGGRNGDGGSHRGPAAVAGASTGGLLSTSQYAPVNSSSSIPGDSGLPNTQAAFEKAAMASAAAAAAHKKKKWKLAIIIAIAVLAIAGVVVGILFGVVFKKDTSAGGGSTTPSHTDNAEDDLKHNGDLDADSPEIKALMNNPDLKKVFVGMDYTPINSQYPECLTNPPSQNNVTRDLAVLSQLTNVVRLYGTDCNQTQMLIHAINQLRLKDTVKIWLGVWQDNNATTNARQLEQMWDILDTYGDSYFKGIIVANEILFRQQMSATELGVLLDEVRKNLTARGINLPVATSDLGDKWDSTLASQSDAIMANIHPFFAGEPAKSAAAWTMLFWNNKVSSFLKKNPEMNIISETGWPTQGGMGCGNEWETDCPQKAVAGIEELNVFMEDFVCQALKNGTQYFWFEAFDEPWKVRFNTPGKEWEDHWGLLTVNRELKKGVVIPDCDGMRVD
jgi:exo-beta-1,3-glucanase (GH17 family)